MLPSPFFVLLTCGEDPMKPLQKSRLRLRLSLLEWRKDSPGFSHPCCEEFRIFRLG